jgi:hypothetical protein
MTGNDEGGSEPRGTGYQLLAISYWLLAAGF